MSGKPNYALLFGDANIVPQQEEVTSIVEKVICNYSVISRFDGIGLDAIILAQMVSFPPDLDLVVTWQSALPLIEMGDSAVHQALWFEPLIKWDLHPEVAAEKNFEATLPQWLGGFAPPMAAL